FELTAEVGEEDTPDKHHAIASRRARQGQCFHQPYFGCREFPVRFRLIEDDEPVPHSLHKGERDLGWMLLDIDYANEMSPRFFRAVMKDGVVEIPRLKSGVAV